MLCSRCSASVTPVIAFDIDGTLGDFHGHFISFLEKYINYQGTHCCGYIQYDGSIEFSDWAMAMYNIDYRTWQDVKLSYRQGAQKRSMPVNPGADEAVFAAARAGCEIWFTTTRPYLRLDNVDPDTRFWLDKVLGVEGLYSGMIYDELKYERFIEIVDAERVIMIVEDLPDMADFAAQIFGERIPVLLDNGYNEGGQLVTPIRVPNLYEIPEMIGHRVHKWRERHGD
jgi:phosphoglycolate phosphatase-like HAD superfamily hydrolase